MDWDVGREILTGAGRGGRRVSRILDGVVNIGFGPLPVRTFRRHGSLKTRRQIQKTKIEGRHPSHRLKGTETSDPVLKQRVRTHG
jgi:hypothetical protein